MQQSDEIDEYEYLSSGTSSTSSASIQSGVGVLSYQMRHKRIMYGRYSGDALLHHLSVREKSMEKASGHALNDSIEPFSCIDFMYDKISHTL